MSATRKPQGEKLVYGALRLYFRSLGDVSLGLRGSNSGQRLKGGHYGRWERSPPQQGKGNSSPSPHLPVFWNPWRPGRVPGCFYLTRSRPGSIRGLPSRLQQFTLSCHSSVFVPMLLSWNDWEEKEERRKWEGLYVPFIIRMSSSTNTSKDFHWNCIESINKLWRKHIWNIEFSKFNILFVCLIKSQCLKYFP